MISPQNHRQQSNGNNIVYLTMISNNPRLRPTVNRGLLLFKTCNEYLTGQN